VSTVDGLRQDLRHALRAMRRSPGFAAVAVLTLALGLGATTAIFAVVHSVVIAPLSYPGANRLVWIDQPVPSYDAQHPWRVSAAGYWDYVRNAHALQTLGAYAAMDLNVSGPEGTRQVPAVKATASLLAVLGARPAVGRLFGTAEDSPGGESAVVLSYGYWQRAFGGDPSVVGQTLRVEGRSLPVIGVLARAFRLPDASADLWLPAQLDPAATPVNEHYLSAIGRLAPDATPSTAAAELNRLVAGFPQKYPQAYSQGFMRQFGFRAEAVPLRDHVVGDAARTLWVLLAAVSVVLLIACANVANLFLVRTEGRRRELALRTALGAARRRLARHYVTESLLLTLLAGALALRIAQSGVVLLQALKPAGLPRLQDITLGATGVVFCLGLATLAGVVFGLFPALRRAGDYQALREGGRGLTATRGEQRVRGGLIVAQVALAVVLLAAGGLLLRSFQRLRAVQPGFDANGVLTLQASLPVADYGTYDRTAAFWRAATERLAALPGVVAVGAGNALPPDEAGSCAVMQFEGETQATSGEGKCIPKAAVTPGYFEALGIQVRGRRPEWRDVDAGTGAVVVTRTLADRLWPGEDPIGKGIHGEAANYYRVVGVADELHMQGLEQAPTPMVFFPVKPAGSLSLWGPYRNFTIVLRARTTAPQALAGAARRTLSDIDPDVAIGEVRTMTQIVARSMARTSFTLLLLGLAGGLALVLAAVGIYGVISYLIARRTGEIGVRMALGASADRVRRQVLAQSLRVAGLGVGIGILAALLLNGLLRSLLYDVSPTDPLTLATSALAILAVAAIATLLPAARAARVQPAEALRAE
jgi:putative ABC transport system permease protein